MEEILSKYFGGEPGTAQRLELIRQMEDNEPLRAEYIRLQNIYALTQLAPHPSHEAEGRKGYNAFRHRLKVKAQRKIIRLAMQCAAAALLLIASTFFLTRMLLFESTGTGEMNTLYVPAGQRAQLTLNDGTQVWLNAQSTLTYPARFFGKRREVSVVGEAYFDVAENREKPFVVTTEQLTMEVLGTEFNVYSYPEAGIVQTSLVKGSLKVSETGKNGQSMLLSPSQQVTYQNSKMQLEPLTNPEHLLWKEGIYAFNNERLIDILAKLELYYDTTIRVEDPEIFNVRYTGKFRQRDGIDEILHILQKIQSFYIQNDKDKNIITLSK
ncbi:MAG: FecR domain-containing protein [Proteiniphilum sp.]|nr:FecR domain-containing protein [Proteiniphilum sp.]MDD4800654.1 FecR domain-containing protein [Proteiniphilum sp.]